MIHVIRFPGRDDRIAIDPDEVIVVQELTPENPSDPKACCLMFRNGQQMIIRDDDRELLDAIHHKRMGYNGTPAEDLE